MWRLLQLRAVGCGGGCGVDRGPAERCDGGVVVCCCCCCCGLGGGR